MGGRLALEALLYHNAPFLSLTCLSTTLEIPDRKSRIEKENEWIEKLSTSSIEEFIDYWYSASIFKGFTPPKRRYNQNKENLIKILNEYSILHSPPFIEKIEKCKTPLHLLYRKNDPKGAKITGLKNTHFINAATHPIHLENPVECGKIIETLFH